MSEQPPVGSPVVVAVTDAREDTRVVVETGLTGWWDIESGQFVIPFASPENGADCLRIIANALTHPAPRKDEP